MSDNFCRRCTRHLTNPRSVKHGYGPVCYRKRMSGDPRQAKNMGPCTIIAPEYARKVYAAIYRLIHNLDGVNLAQGRMLTGKDITTLPVESFDHNAGIILPGFDKPQWFYLHTEQYDLAIWKLHITDQMITDEMEANGDIPEDWKHD